MEDGWEREREKETMGGCESSNQIRHTCLCSKQHIGSKQRMPRRRFRFCKSAQCVRMGYSDGQFVELVNYMNVNTLR